MASHQPNMNWMSGQGGRSIPELMTEHQRQWQEHQIMMGNTNPGTMPPLANPLAGGPSNEMISKSRSMPIDPAEQMKASHAQQQMMNPMTYNSSSNLHINANYASSTNLSVASGVTTPQMGPLSPQFSVASAPNLPPHQLQYAAWQRQFQSANNGAFSASNIPQQMQMQQMQGMYGSNQRLFNQQRRMNGWGTTGQMSPAISPHAGGHGVAHHKQWVSSDDVDHLVEDPDLEQQHSIEHIGFVPPAPQSKAEIEKMVQWQAQRKGIQEQKVINRQIEQQMKAMGTEEPVSYKTPLFTDSSVRQISEYSEIDYALMEESSKKGKCCVIL